MNGDGFVGRYDSSRPVKVDLSFLGRPTGAVVRTVHAPRLAEDYHEVELGFASGTRWRLAMEWPFLRLTRGMRLVLGGVRLDELPVVRSAEPTEAELARVTFGIGTPELYAPYATRLSDRRRDSPLYLLLLDRDGRYVDNHSTGVDRVYLGRREDGRIELYAVSYEREAIVAHWTLPAA